MKPAVTVAALALAWLLPGLFGHDPWKPDEAYTFGLVLHILETGDWVVPTLAGEPFLEKPPLFFLTAAAFAKVFGGLLPLHDAARLATLFYMSIAFCFVALCARRLYGAASASVALLLFVGSIGLLDRGHQLITDTAQLAGFALAAYGFALGLERPRLGGLALGTGAGVAFLAKGLFIPGCLGVSALALPLLSSCWRTRRYLLSLAIAAAAALPWVTIWPAALYVRGPELFDEWLWGLNVGSFIGEDSIAAKPSPFFYLWVLPWFALPAWPLAAWSVWRARAALRSRPEIVLPLVLIAVPLAVLSISTTGRELYAMPMLVPFALLGAPAISAVSERAGATGWRIALAFVIAAGAVVWLAWASLDLGLIEPLQKILLQRQPAYSPQFAPLPFALAVALTVGVGLLVGLTRRRPERLAAAWAAGIALVWGLSMILLLRYLDTSKSYRAMIADLSRALPAAQSCISSQKLGEPQRALLHYFAGIVTYRAETTRARADCRLLLVQGFRNDFPAVRPDWTLLWEGARPGDPKELYRLYRREDAPADRRRRPQDR